MRIDLLAVGRLKPGAERTLCERYRERIAQQGRALGFDEPRIMEINQSKAASPTRRKLEEFEALEAHTAKSVGSGKLVLLDETGEAITSAKFAKLLAKWRDDGVAKVAFVIGGPDGCDPKLGKNASMVLGFGRLTWPHQIVRILLLEQIYRAMTILAGHPYHRQ